MKAINNYILEKFKISKDINNEEEKPLCEKHVTCYSINNDTIKELNRWYVATSRRYGEITNWILLKSDLKHFTNFKNGILEVYKIPKEYTKLKDYIDDLENGKLDMSLEQYTEEEIKELIK